MKGLIIVMSELLVFYTHAMFSPIPNWLRDSICIGCVLAAPVIMVAYYMATAKDWTPPNGGVIP